MKQHFEVENIKCGGCVNSIKTALLKINNVEEVIIDKDIDTVTVVGNIERFLLIKKLNELGYPEKGSNTIIKTAKSYVSCALGKISE
ncbi:MAG: heavy-metal-associated domain-containing protein [Flavobacteriales bacterium]|nr:heavy-metal-associated domain-containing protein [Flavobacteriales bacterium]NCP85404.1 heavy-metal-associated domain-containing protein [Bacteroidota bacterium]PIY09743.1 MAG: heavy metal transporter [Flavobacteriaceae bacterium CG_4_10_14_3_um_filter_33_47]PJB17041.1 MAG: heavy metal transporter [Flavobacteriaceae bacterium CG_4_9_14_3_um_filter_33_16]NCP60456.1 heavy-metal-associated domain-containing protein [Flavobacteriales bacterium]